LCYVADTACSGASSPALHTVYVATLCCYQQPMTSDVDASARSARCYHLDTPGVSRRKQEAYLVKTDDYGNTTQCVVIGLRVGPACWQNNYAIFWMITHAAKTKKVKVAHARLPSVGFRS